MSEVLCGDKRREPGGKRKTEKKNSTEPGESSSVTFLSLSLRI